MMELKEIPVKDIERSPFQQRQNFDEDALRTLADSITAKGIGLVQPIKVRPLSTGKYQLVAGERRLRATILAGRKTIPAIVAEMTDAQSAAQSFAENIHRAGLNPIEKARGILEIYKIQNPDTAYHDVDKLIDILTYLRNKELKRVSIDTNEDRELIRISKQIGYSLLQQIRLLRGLTFTSEQQEIIVSYDYSPPVINAIATIEDKDTQNKVVLGLKSVAETGQTQQEVIRAIKDDPEIANLLTVIPPKDVELTREQIFDIEQRIEQAREMEVEQEKYAESEQGKEQARLIKNWMAHTKLLEGAAHEPFCPKCGKDQTHLRWVCCDIQLAPDAGMLATKAAQKHTNKVIADMLQDRVDYEKAKQED